MRAIELNLYVESNIRETKARKVLAEVGVADEDISIDYSGMGPNKLVVKQVKPKMYKKIMKALGDTDERVYVRF